MMGHATRGMWRRNDLRLRVCLLFSAFCLLAGEAQAQKPRLLVASAQKGTDGRSWCPPCDRFWDDFNGDLEFQQALRRRFQVEVKWVGPQGPTMIDKLNGIRGVPTFLAKGFPIVAGYTGKQDLLERLRLPPLGEGARAEAQLLAGGAAAGQGQQPRDCAAPSPAPSAPPAAGVDLGPLRDELLRQRQEIEALTQALAALAKVRAEPGPAGEQGPPGERGPQGLQGEPGQDGRDVDPAQLAAIEQQLTELNQRLAHLEDQTISLEIYSAGEVVGESASGRLGDPGKRKVRFDVENITQPNR